MIEVKIKALKDFRLNTTVEKRLLVKGEVTAIKFKNKQQVRNLLKFGNFERARIGEPEKKEIPIIRKPKPQVQVSDQSKKEKEKPGSKLDGDFRIENYLTNRIDDNHVVEEVIEEKQELQE